LLSGSVGAVVAMLVIRLGRFGARSGFGLRGVLAAVIAVGAVAGRAASSAAVHRSH
jgi:hypothetical protein